LKKAKKRGVLCRSFQQRDIVRLFLCAPAETQRGGRESVARSRCAKKGKKNTKNMKTMDQSGARTTSTGRGGEVKDEREKGKSPGEKIEKRGPNQQNKKNFGRPKTFHGSGGKKKKGGNKSRENTTKEGVGNYLGLLHRDPGNVGWA